MKVSDGKGISLRKVQGFSGRTFLFKDAGKRCPPNDAGIAPQKIGQALV
jgi:hypothetical protein